MKEQKVFFYNKGQRIAGILHLPDVKNSAAIIMAHGFTGNMHEHGLFANTAREFCKNGIVVLRFDFRGNGESDGKFEDMSITEEISDLKKAIEFVKNKGYTKICLLGLSLGGAVSILSYNDKISAVVLWSSAEYLKEVFTKIFGKKIISEIENKGFYDLYKAPHEWRTTSTFRISRKFWKEVNELDAINVVKKIRCPILIIHGNKDEVVDMKYSKSLFRIANEPKEIKIIEGSDHTYHNPKHEKQVITLSLQFLKKWLK